MRFRYAGREFDLEGVGPEDYIHRFIATTRGFYEIELLEYMRFVNRLDGTPDPVFVDAGANIGNHSVFLGSLPGARVLSVEPNPRVLPVLRRNLEANVPGHAVYDCALGAAAGTGRVVLPGGGASNEGMARVEPGGVGAGGIAIATLDSVLAGYRAARGETGRVRLLKVDVEGAELDVLRGAPTLLAGDRPHVFVEASTPAHAAELAAHLGRAGYAPVTRWGWRATPVIHFAHRPSAGLRLAAHAYQLAALPRWVLRALLRRARERRR